MVVVVGVTRALVAAIRGVRCRTHQYNGQVKRVLLSAAFNKAGLVALPKEALCLSVNRNSSALLTSAYVTLCF